MKLIYAKNIDNVDVTGLLDVSVNPPKLFCVCHEDEANVILNLFKDNNDWIKINSKKDLPKEDDCIYWAMSENGWIENTIYSGWAIAQKYKNKTCTHYQKIDKPCQPQQNH